MDGPMMIGGGGAGGVEIASGFVTIGADMGGLRAAEQEAKEIYSRIAAMGGGGQIGGNVGMVGNPTFGASMPTAGGVTLSIKIDEAGLRQQIDTAIRSYVPQPI